MTILEQVDLVRIEANDHLDPDKKKSLGQFFTPSSISLFMASLFQKIEGDVRVLDPGCGPFSLSAGFLDEVIKRGHCSSVYLAAYDVDENLRPYVNISRKYCISGGQRASIPTNIHFQLKDYILSTAIDANSPNAEFTHVIMNPPYKKIRKNSDHSMALSHAGIETVNLYTGFVGLALKQLKKGGELVAIIPRSFCNGPYYQAFRELILSEAAIRHIHIFDSRNKLFSGDDILQENVIIHLVKGVAPTSVKITSSPLADFHIDKETNTVTASDLTIRTVPFSSIVNSNDKHKIIHIAANSRDQLVIDKIGVFNEALEGVGVAVSTGPVVDFRLKSDLRKDPEEGAVPLIYPIHLKTAQNGSLNWPVLSKKPNSIMVSKSSRNWLWEHKGFFVIVRRFSSKDEKRRIVATVYDSSLPGNLIGFENKLNVYHCNKVGMDRALAMGLYIYLNSTLLDKYYRLFGGHTQVNATDLRIINYPSADILREIGSKVINTPLSQEEIDDLLSEVLTQFDSDKGKNPLSAQSKIDQALDVLKLLGLPKAQQNDRSALTLLALLDLRPDGSWDELSMPLIGVTPIMKWCEDVYGKEYAPNTRETFRRQTLHQFVDAGIALYNPDKPDRPVNSPYACYQISDELRGVLHTFGSKAWQDSLREWLSHRETLIQQYAMKREMEMIPLTLEEGVEVRLSPGEHSKLIHDIICNFGPRFVRGAEVIYIGDTGAKEDYFKRDRLEQLGVTVDRKGKLPDVVLYWKERNWLILVESVTSHGPVDGKRHADLTKLFKNSTAGLVYVTAFPSRKEMGKFLSTISWETEVWVAEAPEHMIHFNGDRFLGPHE